ncbi:MFS transporter [Enterobacterales bacterium CwR94]|nr:MFS transporter [Enterobacterales bacterium CwR94]
MSAYLHCVLFITEGASMTKSPPLWLLMLLTMFPQIAETLYSPALPAISRAYGVEHAIAAQTLSIYFLAFAPGVVFWGIFCDRKGRRTAMLAGLVIYMLAAVAALFSTSITELLVLRAISAFGAAVGSVVTQTMLRDCFQGGALAKVFATLGAGIAMSPALGMVLGGGLVSLSGHLAVFAALATLAAMLIICSLFALPETRPTHLVNNRECLPVARAMLRDRALQHSALLVAGFNLLIFTWYQQGAALFVRLGMSVDIFGYSGLLLAIATLLGSLINRAMLTHHLPANVQVRVACIITVIATAGGLLLQDRLWVIVPVGLMAMAFGMGIPALLSQALVAYSAQRGTAGALFGLYYYLLLALGLTVMGYMEQWFLALFAVSVAMCLLALRRRDNPV